MTQPLLEDNAKSLNYGELPEVWRVPKIERFSRRKTLYDYQRDALENAARALYRFYGEGEKPWRRGESPRANRDRKRRFVQSVYMEPTIRRFGIEEYETEADRRNLRRNPVFKILSEYMDPQGDAIYYYQLINRMCFWMATGSGKTLVMVKIIEYLRHLKERQQIPSHNILVLAPSEHLIKQIRLTIEEFNEEGLNIDLVPLREFGKVRQARLGDVETVYYHRSDNLSDVQKDALTDYHLYENGGKWFVLLDEAHKGGKDDSKRQAYYALMAREGFLFNFSATFTDDEDIVTTVKKYNLQEFIQNGHGKNIYLNESEYRAFKNRDREVGGEKKKQIVLKSLITLAHASRQVARLRQDAGNDEIYHLPLMLTLVNSVNTSIEDDSNDLWVFFQVLRQIAEGGIDEMLFNAARDELLQDWGGAQLLFGGGGKVDETLIGGDRDAVASMTVEDLREKVFLSRHRGRLQIIRGKESNKELAFQLVNADRPFAMFRIGDTSRWRNEFLVGFEETTALQEQGFFDSLETSDITILMGSRAFFESWDSKRPNIINFINIGGSDAKKFVVQAVGRGVRIEPLPNERRRLGSLPPQAQSVLQDCVGKVGPLETLFLFATNRAAINSVLDGMDAERGSGYERVTGFKRAKRPKVNGNPMPLLVPEYQQEAGKRVKAKFTLGENTLARFRRWLDNTPDSVFVVRDGLTPQQINSLREEAKEGDNFRINQDKEYDSLPFLQERLLSHLSVNAQTAKGMRALNEQEGHEDIVHFREVRANLESYQLNDLKKTIKRVVQGGVSEEERKELAIQYANQEISWDEFSDKTSGQFESEAESIPGLKIKHVAAHYYLPMVIGETGMADFIKHIVKVKSEVDFLNALDEWLRGEGNKPQWDAWMFSKIDESLDKVHIPYFDEKVNEYRRFLPDFVFWMCKGDQYQIVFVDPKGVAHASSYRKIDGYEALFEKQGQCREFSTRFPLAKNVKVKLLLFNPDPDQSPSRKYARYWRDRPEAIFA